MAGEKQFSSMEASNSFKNYSLNYDTPVDADLQEKVEAIDTRLRPVRNDDQRHRRWLIGPTKFAPGYASSGPNGICGECG